MWEPCLPFIIAPHAQLRGAPHCRYCADAHKGGQQFCSGTSIKQHVDESHWNGTHAEEVSAKEKMKQNWTDHTVTIKGGKKLYHCTSEQNAQSIERGGFRLDLMASLAAVSTSQRRLRMRCVSKAHNHRAVLKCRVNETGEESLILIEYEENSSLKLPAVKKVRGDSVRIPRWAPSTASTSHHVPKWSNRTRRKPRASPFHRQAYNQSARMRGMDACLNVCVLLAKQSFWLNLGSGNKTSFNREMSFAGSDTRHAVPYGLLQLWRHRQNGRLILEWNRASVMNHRVNFLYTA